MKTLNKILLISLSLFIFSCDDILEEDITNDIVQVISPTKDAVVESNVVNFKWNSLKGADKYRVQVYEYDQVLILDSLTTKTNLTLPLAAGSYIWRVRAENYAYQSTYSFPSNFSTNIPDDLTNQQVILLTPDSDKYLNFTNITLNWEQLDNATSYSVRVVNTVTGQEVYPQTDLTDTYLTLDLPELADGNYEWRVKAKNAETETRQYAAKRFNVDTTAPNQPKNSLPADNATQTVNTAASFTWTIASDIGNIKSPISYVVEIATDIDFTSNLQTLNSNTTTLSYTFATAGTYFWRVRAVDVAGNIGTNSTGFKITVN
ncbi:hypothetical protein [Flavobacterium sp. DG2-3]|uniref:hypothetical protein n=1 Tax=Flavobacterium sp. DG2-3 TaxID=3068317 RepID=UPI00273DC9A4|nr:hypothetical protein [Flavobacterium sp. DG2-3]MDP5201883.1 hypothetical protein [Flavobacterium sp. DG2-3]